MWGGIECKLKKHQHTHLYRYKVEGYWNLKSEIEYLRHKLSTNYYSNKFCKLNDMLHRLLQPHYHKIQHCRDIALWQNQALCWKLNHKWHKYLGQYMLHKNTCNFSMVLYYHFNSTYLCMYIMY